MKLILLLMLTLSTGVMAQSSDCKPPIKEQILTYQKTNNTPVYFAGFYIELPSPQKMGFFNEDLLLKYPNKKVISLSYITSILTEGRSADYDPVAVYKEAFGLLPKQAKNNNEIKAIARLQRLCNNEIISYKTNNIDYQIIRTKYPNSFSDNQSIDTFILAKEKAVYKISFKGFTNNEIDQLLSTIHK